jgi:hypothetical protein
MTVSVTIAGIMITFKAEENIFALPLRRLEVGRPDGVDAVPGPNQIAIVAKNIGPRLTRTMLLSRSIGIPSERGYEKISFLNGTSCRDGDVEARRR